MKRRYSTRCIPQFAGHWSMISQGRSLPFRDGESGRKRISSAPASSVVKEVQTPAERTPLDLLFEKAAEKGAESEITSRNMSRTNAPSGDEDDTPVDVPQLSDNRPAAGQQRLGSDTDIRSFEMRERLYGAAVRELRREEPYRPVIKEETDAKIAGAAIHPVPEYRIVGEVFNCYVIIETEGKMIIFDKHAAHERINFERLRANMSSDTPNVRMLLEPISLPLTAEEAQICREYKPELEKVGFEFDASDREASLRGIPEDFGMAEAKELFLGLVTGMLEGGEPIEIPGGGVFLKRRFIKAPAKLRSRAAASTTRRISDGFATICFGTTASNFAHMDGRWRLSSIKRSWRAASDVHKFFEYAGCSPAGGIICLLC